MTKKDFNQFINKNKHIWTKEKYNFFRFNCNDWSYLAVQKLTGETEIPREAKDQMKNWYATPLGKLFKFFFQLIFKTKHRVNHWRTRRIRRARQPDFRDMRYAL